MAVNVWSERVSSRQEESSEGLASLTPPAAMPCWEMSCVCWE